MLWLYLKIWEWELMFGRAGKAISSKGVRSPCYSTYLPLLSLGRPIPDPPPLQFFKNRKVIFSRNKQQNNSAPLQIFEASYGTVTSDEIPSPMWDLILKGFKRNPTWAFEENKKKQRRCSKHYAINLSVFEVFQFHQIFQSCPINHTLQGINSENFFKRN